MFISNKPTRVAASETIAIHKMLQVMTMVICLSAKYKFVCGFEGVCVPTSVLATYHGIAKSFLTLSR